MLNKIHRLLGPKLLYLLHRMGHGDEIALVDANYPAHSCARRLVRMDGVSATGVLAAVMTVFPLDSYVDCPVNTMEVVGDAEAVPEIVVGFREIIARDSRQPVSFGTLTREAFYERSRSAFGIVATGEQRLYGNMLLTKGIAEPSD